jgi:hypothetical protein
VTITGGNEVHHDEATGYWSVPKRELVGTLQVLLQNHRLKIGAELPEASVLVAELRNFRARINASGHDSYGAGPAADWRDGAHDDLVLATAVAAWYAERANRYRGAFVPGAGATGWVPKRGDPRDDHQVARPGSGWQPARRQLG